MLDYRVETRVSSDKSLTLRDLPFAVGDQVEVIVRSQEHPERNGKRYPLRGKPVRYTEPFRGVAEEDWEALQ
ncbi:MAG: hypothetical protein FJ280_08250 [Planctomycetes bacterium]|nr:hypothetical protein [Planctomycetota bacterium]